VENKLIKIEVKDDGLTTRLNATIERMQNLRPAMEEIGEYVTNSVLRNFDSGGRHALWKQNIFGTQVMMKSGATHRGIHKENVTDHSVEVVSTGGGNYQHRDHSTKNSLLAKRFFWFKYKQTKLQQWKNLAISNKTDFEHKSRRFMMFQESDILEIKNILQTYLTKGE
jgi:phage gpG-like protein